MSSSASSVVTDEGWTVAGAAVGAAADAINRSAAEPAAMSETSSPGSADVGDGTDAGDVKMEALFGKSETSMSDATGSGANASTRCSRAGSDAESRADADAGASVAQSSGSSMKKIGAVVERSRKLGSLPQNGNRLGSYM